MDRIEKYDLERANKYDEESDFDKGNRQQHCHVLKYILSYKEGVVRNFLELGCGTGFYSTVFLDRYPEMNSILLDGSADMLNIAKEKLAGKGNVQFVKAMLESIDWESLPSLDIVYSALTIHHLTHEDKYKLYGKIYKQLTSGGRFLYFDQFKLSDEETNEMIEYLACKDIQHRLIDKLGITENEIFDEIEIDRIIQNDRSVKASENDKEDVINNTLRQLEAAGFRLVATIYQEFRFFGIIAIK